MIFKKKDVFKLSLLAIFTFSLSSCVSVNAKNFSYKERALEGTPEDSVIFYGMYFGATDIHYTQDNSRYAPDHQEFNSSNGVVVSAPVKTGSHYHCEYMKGAVRTSMETATVFDSEIPMNYKGLDVQVPSKPGLYYIGFWEAVKSFESVSNKPFDGNEFLYLDWDEKKAEIEILKAAKNVYKGTSWEAVIDERITELQK